MSTLSPEEVLSGDELSFWTTHFHSASAVSFTDMQHALAEHFASLGYSDSRYLGLVVHCMDRAIESDFQIDVEELALFCTRFGSSLRDAILNAASLFDSDDIVVPWWHGDIDDATVRDRVSAFGVESGLFLVTVASSAAAAADEDHKFTLHHVKYSATLGRVAMKQLPITVFEDDYSCDKLSDEAEGATLGDLVEELLRDSVGLQQAVPSPAYTQVAERLKLAGGLLGQAAHGRKRVEELAAQLQEQCAEGKRLVKAHCDQVQSSRFTRHAIYWHLALFRVGKLVERFNLRFKATTVRALEELSETLGDVLGLWRDAIEAQLFEVADSPDFAAVERELYARAAVMLRDLTVPCNPDLVRNANAAVRAYEEHGNNLNDRRVFWARHFGILSRRVTWRMLAHALSLHLQHEHHDGRVSPELMTGLLCNAVRVEPSDLVSIPEWRDFIFRFGPLRVCHVRLQSVCSLADGDPDPVNPAVERADWYYNQGNARAFCEKALEAFDRRADMQRFNLSQKRVPFFARPGKTKPSEEGYNTAPWAFTMSVRESVLGARGSKTCKHMMILNVSTSQDMRRYRFDNGRKTYDTLSDVLHHFCLRYGSLESFARELDTNTARWELLMSQIEDMNGNLQLPSRMRSAIVEFCKQVPAYCEEADASAGAFLSPAEATAIAVEETEELAAIIPPDQQEADVHVQLQRCLQGSPEDFAQFVGVDLSAPASSPQRASEVRQRLLQEYRSGTVCHLLVSRLVAAEHAERGKWFTLLKAMLFKPSLLWRSDRHTSRSPLHVLVEEGSRMAWEELSRKFADFDMDLRMMRSAEMMTLAPKVCEFLFDRVSMMEGSDSEAPDSLAVPAAMPRFVRVRSVRGVETEALKSKVYDNRHYEMHVALKKCIRSFNPFLLQILLDKAFTLPLVGTDQASFDSILFDKDDSGDDSSTGTNLFHDVVGLTPSELPHLSPGPKDLVSTSYNPDEHIELPEEEARVTTVLTDSMKKAVQLKMLDQLHRALRTAATKLARHQLGERERQLTVRDRSRHSSSVQHSSVLDEAKVKDRASFLISRFLEAKDEQGCTVTNLAAKNGERELLAYVVETLGGRCDTLDDDDRSTAHYVCRNVVRWAETEQTLALFFKTFGGKFPKSIIDRTAKFDGENSSYSALDMVLKFILRSQDPNDRFNVDNQQPALEKICIFLLEQGALVKTLADTQHLSYLRDFLAVQMRADERLRWKILAAAVKNADGTLVEMIFDCGELPYMFRPPENDSTLILNSDQWNDYERGEADGPPLQSILHVAVGCERQSPKVVSLLLDHVPTEDDVDVTFQHIRCVDANGQRVPKDRRLACLTANPEEIDRRGRTALHIAAELTTAYATREEVGGLLIDRFDVMKKDFRGYTPLHYAADTNHLGFVQLLLEAHAPPDATTTHYTHGEDQELRDLYARLTPFDQADVPLPSDIYKQTPLHLAASKGYWQVCAELLKADAEVDPVDAHGQTPLCSAMLRRMILLEWRELMVQSGTMESLDNLALGEDADGMPMFQVDDADDDEDDAKDGEEDGTTGQDAASLPGTVPAQTHERRALLNPRREAATKPRLTKKQKRKRAAKEGRQWDLGSEVQMGAIKRADGSAPSARRNRRASAKVAAMIPGGSIENFLNMEEDEIMLPTLEEQHVKRKEEDEAAAVDVEADPVARSKQRFARSYNLTISKSTLVRRNQDPHYEERLRSMEFLLGELLPNMDIPRLSMGAREERVAALVLDFADASQLTKLIARYSNTVTVLLKAGASIELATEASGEDLASLLEIESDWQKIHGSVHFYKQQLFEERLKDFGVPQLYEKELEQVWNDKANQIVIDYVYREKVRSKHCLRLLMYLVFVVLVTVLGIHHVARDKQSAFWMSEGLDQVLIGDEYPAEVSKLLRNFEGIDSKDELYMWMRGPFLDILYPSANDSSIRLWVGSTASASRGLGFIGQQTRILGVPRLRQVRSRVMSCDVPSDLDFGGDGCLSTAIDEATDDFGPGGVYKWSSAAKLEGLSTWGNVAWYEGSGYALNLPPPTNATARGEMSQVIDSLEENNWIDARTRAVFVEFSGYNANENHFVTATMLIEFPRTGGTVVSSDFNLARLRRYVDTHDYSVVLTLEIVCLLMVLWKMGSTVYGACCYDQMRAAKTYEDGDDADVPSDKSSSSTSIWRTEMLFRLFPDSYALLNVLIFLLFVSAFGIHVQCIVWAQDIDWEATDSFVPTRRLARYTMVQTQFVSVLVFLAWFKIFDYLTPFKSLARLVIMIEMMLRELKNFTVLLVITLIAFTSGEYIASSGGYSQFDSSTWLYSLLTRLSFMFAGREIDSRPDSNRILGVLYPTIFVVVVGLLQLNLLIAILTSAYEDAADQAGDSYWASWQYEMIVLEYGTNWSTTTRMDPLVPLKQAANWCGAQWRRCRVNCRKYQAPPERLKITAIEVDDGEKLHHVRRYSRKV